MRIVYLHQYFNTPNMSGSTRSYDMAKRLVAMGHEVDMVTSWRENDGRTQYFRTDEDGIRVHWLPVPYSNHLGYLDRISSFMRFAVASGRLASSLSGDVVFASSTPLTIALPGVFAARRLRVPLVFEVRDLWPKLPIAVGALRNPALRHAARLLERFAYRNSAAIVALSDGMRDGVAATGYPVDRISVIPNSSDLDRFYPDPVARAAFRVRSGIDPDTTLVAYAGTFGRINGVGWLAELAAAMRRDGRVTFLVIGDGQEYTMVEQLARDRGCLGTNFRMMHKVSKAEMPSVLAAADIAISTVIPLPELEANSANKFFDGLAAGCCMTVNHGGWQADLLQVSGAGFRLPRDIGDAARELGRWLDKPEAIADAGRNARRLAETRFSSASLASHLERVLIDVYQRQRICERRA